MLCVLVHQVTISSFPLLGCDVSGNLGLHPFRNIMFRVAG
jgi:hypothetical protein